MESTGQFTLLLVDDNPVNLTLLAKIIELDLPQVRVLLAANGKEALLLAQREEIDGAFIDVQMPEMSGLELCRHLKADPRTAGMPLVLITAHMASPEMRAEGLEVGAYDFISQPISNVEMLARIKVMLRLCQGERRLRDESREGRSAVADPTQLRFLSGLLLSGNGSLSTADRQLMQELAAEHPAGEKLDERLLAEQWSERFPLPWQRTLLKLSLLDRTPLALVIKLSEIDDIEGVSSYLRRHGLLLQADESEGCFTFSAELQNLIRNKAEQLLPADVRHKVCLLAADWFQQNQDPYGALTCLLRVGDYEAISQLLSQSGLQLSAERYQPQLFELLRSIPEERAVACGWMALYRGMFCLRNRPLEADSWLELARTRFAAAADQRGELLALSQQILQYLLADGRLGADPELLAQVYRLVDHQLQFLDPFSRLSVLFSKGIAELFFGGKLKACEETLGKAMSEAVRENDYEQQQRLHLLQGLLALYQGRFRVAMAGLEQGLQAGAKFGKATFPGRILAVVACELLFSRGDLISFRRQHRVVQNLYEGDSLQQSAMGFLLNWFTACCHLALGQPAAAAEQLELISIKNAVQARSHLRNRLLQLRGLIHAVSGQQAEAKADLDLVTTTPVVAGLYELTSLLLTGATASLLQRHAWAEEQLLKGLQCSQELREERCRPGLHAWLAAVCLEQGKPEQALQQLELLFELLRRQGVDFFFALTPDLLRALVPLAATRADWLPQLRRLCERWLDCALSMDGRLIPRARIQVLGGFRFCLGSRSYDLGEVGQSSRQMLALLAVAPNHALSTEALMAALWPESPPSKARNSFDTALSRLRKGLENSCGKQVRQDYLLLDKGMLMLRHVRIDSVQFQLSMEKAQRHLQRQNYWQAELAFREAEHDWHGEFLAGFELEADLSYRREDYNFQYLELLTQLAGLLQRRGEFGEAISLLVTGRQLEPSNDLLLRQLIDIYLLQGETGTVRRLVEDYRRILREEDYEEEEIDELMTTLGPQRVGV